MMGKKPRRITFAVVLAVMIACTVSAHAGNGYYNSYCASCHTNMLPPAGRECAGCHIHGVKSSRGSSSINLTATTDKNSYMVNETITVRITGGNQSGWGRYVVYDVNGKEVARSTGRTLTFTATEPMALNYYTASYFGNDYHESTFGEEPFNTLTRTGYRPSGTANHGEEIVATNAFEIVAAAPDINLNPALLDFGTVTLGGSSSKSIMVENQGASPLTVSSIVLNGINSGEVSFSPSSFTVPAGGGQTLTVSYTPGNIGPDSGYLAIISDDPDEPQVVLDLAGSGVAAPEPDINLNPAVLDFGNITIGVSVSRDVVVENTGTSDLMVTSVGLCSGTSSEYAFSSASTPFTLPAGANRTVTVSYTPADTGDDIGCLEIASNDPDEGRVVLDLAGTGVAAPEPDINLNPAGLDFGTVSLGTEGSREVVVRNLGTATLTVTSVSLCSGTSGEFSFTPASFELQPGDSQILAVSYAPVDTGADSGCLEIVSDDPDENPVMLNLAGSGAEVPVPDINLSPGVLNFGDVILGNSSSRAANPVGNGSMDTVVQNLGSSDLTVTSVNLCVGTSDEFSVTPTGPFTLSAGESQTLTITYTPVDVGTDNGCLEIVSNDPDENPATIKLSGSGVAEPAPDINLNPVALDFGTVTLGGAGSKDVMVENPGTSDLTVSSVDRCAGTNGEFTYTPTSFTVPAGGSQRLRVTYTPETVGPNEGCLEIVSNDADTPAAELALSGIGAEAGTQLVDLDIIRLRTAGWMMLRRNGTRPIRVLLIVKNNGEFDAPRPATIVGMQNGQEVFSEIQMVSDPVERGITRVWFGPFMLNAPGVVTWTVKISDDDPDVDEAMARTRVVEYSRRRSSDDDNEPEREDDGRERDD